MKTLFDIRNHWRWNRSLVISFLGSVLLIGILIPLLAVGTVDDKPGVIHGVCTLLGLSNTCGTGNTAGIAKLWAIPKDDVTAVTFDASGRVDSVTLAAGKVWAAYEFEEDTGFFNQPVTVTKSNISIKHTVQFENAKMDTTKRNELMNFIECGLCGMILIIKDNNGIFWFSGVNRDGETATYTVKPHKPITSPGGETGADSEADENKFTTVTEAKNSEYAREWTLGEAGIVTTYP